MSEFNADELNPPTWMDDLFFEEVIKCSDGDSAKVVDYKIVPATKKGDHYASVMFRAIVRFASDESQKEIKERSLIIKTKPEMEGFKKELLKESPIFRTEISIFKNIIPRCEELLKQCGHSVRLGAKLFYSSLEPNTVIVLEDVTKSDYFMVDRFATLEEIRLAVKRLAQWHAAGWKLQEDGDKSLQNFNYGTMNLINYEATDSLRIGYQSFLKMISKHPELAKFVDRIKEIEWPLVRKSEASYSNANSDVSVLIHGDFHVKNMLFKRDDQGKLEDVVFCDYQLCVWTSIAVDILYFLYMLVEGKLRKSHRDELISLHYEHFRKTLIELGFKGTIPKFVDIQVELVKHRHLELLLLILMCPFVHNMTKKDKSDMANFEVEDPANIDMSAVFDVLYQNEEYVEDVKDSFPDFVKKGFLLDFD